MIELDGSEGECGGRILRTALTLAMISGQAFKLRNIRAGRAKPGLLRQYLTVVQAAATISDATVDGAELASRQLRFVAGSVRAGDYRFAIGTAGSTTLVLQTLLPAPWCADAPSSVQITGGTHNAMAPPMECLREAWLTVVARMAAAADITLLRHGFFAADGVVQQARRYLASGAAVGEYLADQLVLPMALAGVAASRRCARAATC